MRRCGQALCLMLAALLLCSLASVRTAAAESVYFVAVNEKLYPLSDDTMPFWSGGSLYVPSTVLEGNDLGIHYIRNRETQLASLYKGSRYGIVFDLTTGNAESRDGQTFSAPLIIRGNVLFFPLDVVCRFFSLSYSSNRISYGYLIRIRDDSAGHLTDAQFIDAAGSAMASRYAQYERARTTPEDTPQGGGTEPSVTPPVTPPQPEAQERTVYLLVESTAPDRSEQLLGSLSAGQAVFLFRPDRLDAAGGLLRRLAAGEGSAALRVDASAGAQEALAQIEAGNRALWAAANAKTRLVLLDGGNEETARAVAEAGYCPLRVDLDFGEGLPSVTRLTSRIFAAADANRGSCCVLLGTDEAAAGVLEAMLTSFRAGNCAPGRLNEAIMAAA